MKKLTSTVKIISETFRVRRGPDKLLAGDLGEPTNTQELSTHTVEPMGLVGLSREVANHNHIQQRIVNADANVDYITLRKIIK